MTVRLGDSLACMLCLQMYKMIGKALKDKGLEGVSPKRYLNFFCLGNREVS